MSGFLVLDEKLKKQIEEEAFHLAHEHTKKHGIKAGSLVFHPSDRYIYKLLRMEGEQAIVWLSAEVSPTKQEIEKRFPVDELFDAVVTHNFVLSLRDEAIARTTGLRVRRIDI